MSHAPERKEKDCLNCGTTVQGHFCHVCGQQNVVPKEGFWKLVIHFFYDITHFDSKFFDTLRYLIFRPGYLSKEYGKGRRARYLNPVKMYVFTSAVFFIIFFSLFNAEEMKMRGFAGTNKLQKTVDDFSDEAYKNARTREDSLAIDKALAMVNLGEPPPMDTTGDNRGFRVTFGDAATWYKTVAVYDSVQRSLPASEKDNWVERQLNRRSISLEEKYGDNRQQLWKDLFNKFIHTIPYMLFVSLPLYGLWLKLLYIRRKNFYFADHGIFLIHLYIFTFLLLLAFFVFDKMETITHLGVWNFLKTILVLAGIFYAYKAMKNFYGQGTGKTLLKFFLFNILCIISLIILFGLFFIFSFYRV